MANTKTDVVVIGAGAAGIIAAWSAAKEGARVTLLEKTSRIGTKILISGGGKCNITHAGTIHEVLHAFRKNEANFLKSACYRFKNDEIVSMLTSCGLRVYTRDDGRIFPVDQTAKDVVAILQTYLSEVNVRLMLNTPVRTILTRDGVVSGVKLPDQIIDTSTVILATGGSSYPKTGTTGDGWPWASKLGHRIIPVKAALAPIELAGGGHSSRAGISLQDIGLSARGNGRELSKWRGDLVFTHRGISGPTALGITREIAEFDGGPVEIFIDLRPDALLEKIQRDLLSAKERRASQSIASELSGLMPKNLLPYFLDSNGLSTKTVFQQVGKKELNRLGMAIKAWQIGTVLHVPLDKGEVVAGGVALDEVDPQTMASKLCPGLYLCGEVLDIAGPVGGYNLQAAFATGFVAGQSAAAEVLSKR